MVSNIHACGGFKLDFRFFSIVWHASKQRRKLATRGMGRQHLVTFERGVAQKGPVRVLEGSKGTSEVRTKRMYLRLMTSLYIMLN